MLKVYFSPDILDTELIQIGSVVEVATDAGFTNLIYDSGDDYDQITVHLANLEFIPTNTYYVRARLIYNFGLSDYLVDSFVAVAGDVNELQLYPLVPIKVPIPKILLDFEANQHPNDGVRFRSGYRPRVMNPIVSTTWLIEDTLGKPILYVPNSNIDLLSIIVTNLLEKNKVYVVKCRHNLLSGDSSLFGTEVIYTSTGIDFRLIMASIVKTDVLFTLTYTKPLYQTSIEYEVYHHDILVSSGTSSTDTIDVSDILTYSTGHYIIRAKAVGTGIESEWEYYLAVINEDSDDVLPHTLPYNL